MTSLICIDFSRRLGNAAISTFPRAAGFYPPVAQVRAMLMSQWTLTVILTGFLMPILTARGVKIPFTENSMIPCVKGMSQK